MERFRDDPRDVSGTIPWSLSAIPAALEEGQARAGGDPPDLFQDAPGVIVSLHHALMHGLGEVLEGGVLRRGRTRAGQLPPCRPASAPGLFHHASVI